MGKVSTIFSKTVNLNYTLKRVKCHAFYQKWLNVGLSLLQGSFFLSDELNIIKGKMSRIFSKRYIVGLSLLQGSFFLSKELNTTKGKGSRIFSKWVKCSTITFTGVVLPL